MPIGRTAQQAREDQADRDRLNSELGYNEQRDRMRERGQDPGPWKPPQGRPDPHETAHQYGGRTAREAVHDREREAGG